MLIPLAYMRHNQARLLPDTVIVQRKLLVNDGMGGQTTQWIVAHENIKCRISAPDIGRFAYRPQEDAFASMDMEIRPYLVTLGLDEDVTLLDRLVYRDVTVLEVTKRISGGGWETAMRFVCKEIGPNE